MKTNSFAAVLTLSTLAAVSALGCAAPTAAATTSTAAAGRDPVDGKTYAVSGALPNGTPLQTTLSFKDGVFDSSVCHAAGYMPAHYTLKREGERLAFRTEMKGKDGVEVWAGHVDGSRIEGTVTEPDGRAIAFQGQAQ